jgi:hypothetical protein
MPRRHLHRRRPSLGVDELSALRGATILCREATEILARSQKACKRKVDKLDRLWPGAAELTEVLRRRLKSAGGLALQAERVLARELVRRARRAEQLQEVLQRLLRAGEALAGQGAWPPVWGAAAALAREVLQTGRVETGSG